MLISFCSGFLKKSCIEILKLYHAQFISYLSINHSEDNVPVSNEDNVIMTRVHFYILLPRREKKLRILFRKKIDSKKSI